MKMMKKLAATALTLVMAMLCVSAFAESNSSTPAAESETVAQLLELQDFKFFVKDEGIGKGTASVYTAPSRDSLRLADGKASCSVEDEIAVAGYDSGWLLVRYEIGKKDEKDKKVRVGYIPGSNYKTGRDRMNFATIKVKLAEDAEITDNPRHNSTPYGTLSEGTEITILAKYTYTGNWWYVETELEGKRTRGFIDRGETAILADGTVYHGNEELGFPVTSPEGTIRIGTVTISGKEEHAMIVRKRADTDSPMVARVYGGESFPCYAAGTGVNGKTWYQIWVDGVWGWFSSASSTFQE